MKKFLMLLLTLFYFIIIQGQNTFPELSHNKLLWTDNNMFYVDYFINQKSLYEKPWIFKMSSEKDDIDFKNQTYNISSEVDTVSFGNDGYEGAYTLIYTDKDTLTIPYVNAPYKQWLYIPIGSKTDTVVYLMRFNHQRALYSEDYVKTNQSEFNIQHSEIYELANIILYLTNCSKKTNNHVNGSEYSSKVEKYFGKYRNHPLIHTLNLKCEKDDEVWKTYYGFRENSVCFSINEIGQIEFNTPYKTVIWDKTQILGGEFRALLYLIQDFVNKTNFRSFYKENKKYYTKLTLRMEELIPIKKMWEWLETEFPQRFDSYKIIFSPLIIGSHSTQQFSKGNFKECLMFVNSPERHEIIKEKNENIKKGLMSGIVFTEIDHNYVNPTSFEKRNLIKDLMKDKSLWADKKVKEQYRNELGIFNEYMTHSLFCLYIKENNSEKYSKKIITERVKLMKERGFIKFEAFNECIESLMLNNEVSIYDFYEEIIRELKKIK